MFVFRFLICFMILGLTSISSTGQVSLSQLKGAGINSEEDLKKLGIPQSEIDKAKADLLKPKNGGSSNVGGEVDEKVKKEEIKSISVPKAKYNTEKKKEVELVYGQSVFRSGAVNIIKNSDRIKAPDDYVIGAGDKISVTIWGFSEFSDEFTVGELGNITPKLVGRINLKGKSFKTAKAIVKSRFGKVYDLKNSQIAVDLSYSKVISVNVLGEVQKPGTYSVPSVNSAFNILALAGGPTKLGSVRSIEIRRNGKLISELDVYNFMMKQGIAKIQYLQDGDFIVVNQRKGVVSVSGEVNRSGVYEYKDGDSWSDLERYFGGYKALADTASISIVRVANSELRLFSKKSISVNGDFDLKDGDRVVVLPIADLVRGKVEVSGAVNIEGAYQFEQGMKVFDLITKAKGLNHKAYTETAHLIRIKPDLTEEVLPISLVNVMNDQSSSDNFLLNEFDKVLVFSKDSFLVSKTVTISGMVKSPGKIVYRDGMTLNDLVLLSNGLKDEADKSKIEIERLTYTRTGKDSSYIKIFTVNFENDKSFKIQPLDRVSFRKLPEFTFYKSIEIVGQVKYPGKYSLSSENDKVLDLIMRAGGVTDWAYLKKAKIYRTEDSLGLLVLNLEKVLKSARSKYNYILRPGDRIEIPKVNDVVSINGAIGFKSINEKSNGINTPYIKGKRASFYIKKFGGGYDVGAKRRGVYVVGYDGIVKHSKFFGIFKPRVNKGDKIVVNYKEKKASKSRNDKVNWNERIESITIKLTGLATLWAVLDRISNQ